MSINVLEKCLLNADGCGCDELNPLGGDPDLGGELNGDLLTGDEGAVFE